MTQTNLHGPEEIRPEEIDAEAVIQLPERLAMSLIDGSSLGGVGGLTGTPTDGGGLTGAPTDSGGTAAGAPQLAGQTSADSTSLAQRFTNNIEPSQTYDPSVSNSATS